MYRVKRESETRSDFYLIENPFDEQIHQITKEEARNYIRENELHVAKKDNTGRIWDTAAQHFQREWAASEVFRKKDVETKEQTETREKRKQAYKKELFTTLDWVWDGIEPPKTKEPKRKHRKKDPSEKKKPGRKPKAKKEVEE